MNVQALVAFLIQTSMVLVILAFAMQCRWSDIAETARQPRLLVRAFLAINVVVPLVALAIIMIFPLDRPVAVGLILMAVSPLAPLAPGNELKAGGERSSVIGVYTLMIILAIVIVPLTIAIINHVLGTTAVAPLPMVARVVFVSAVIPIAVGLALAAIWPDFSRRVAPIISKAAFALLIILVLLVLWVARGPFLSLFGDGTILAFAATTLAGIVAGHLLGGPDLGSRGALAIAAATRHPGIAGAIAHANLADTRATLATILFLLNGVVMAALYQAWLKRRMVRGATEPRKDG